MKTTLTLTLALATAFAAFAQPGNINAPAGGHRGFGGPGGPRGMGAPAGPPPIFLMLDADRDGALSAAEIATVSAALTKLDKNGDGQLTPDEVCIGPEGQGPGRRPDRGTNQVARMDAGAERPQHPPMLMVLFDTDRDGVISAAEITAAAGVLAKLDKDGDGQIVLGELRPAGMGGGPRGMGSGRGGPRHQGPPQGEEPPVGEAPAQ